MGIKKNMSIHYVKDAIILIQGVEISVNGI